MYQQHYNLNRNCVLYIMMNCEITITDMLNNVLVDRANLNSFMHSFHVNITKVIRTTIK